MTVSTRPFEIYPDSRYMLSDCFRRHGMRMPTTGEEWQQPPSITKHLGSARPLDVPSASARISSTHSQTLAKCWLNISVSRGC